MDSMTMNEAELTLLSLLAEGDRYGHEIQQLIEQRGLRAWVAIGFSSVFYLLGKLERQGLVSAALFPDALGAARKRYGLTEAGRGVLQTALADLLRQPRALGEGFELALANLGVLKPHQVYQNLSHHYADLAERLARIERDWAAHRDAPNDPQADSIGALYTHSIALMRAELAWLGEFLAAWKARYPASDRADTPASPTPAVPTDATAGEAARKTLLNRRVTPDHAKMIQKLRRPPENG